MLSEMLVNMLVETTKVESCEQFRTTGKGPENLFSKRTKDWSEKAASREGGKEAKKKLLDTSSAINLLELKMLDGREPCSLLFLTKKYCKFVSKPISSQSVPEIWLYSKTKFLRDVKLPTSVGKVPEMDVPFAK